MVLSSVVLNTLLNIDMFEATMYAQQDSLYNLGALAESDHV